MTHATPDAVHVDDDDIALVEAAVALKDAALELGGQAKATVRAAHRELMQVAGAHPYALAGGAAGVGFVVAGGLTAPATRAVVSMGLKLGSAFVVDAAIAALRGPQKQAPATAPAPAEGAAATKPQMSPTNHRREE
jgi:hypothetical protein